VVDVAFAINVQRTNLENVTDLGSATITMTVSEAWVQEHGAENVRIFRVTETGETEILETTLVSSEGGIYTFEGISPQGLSVFGLVAVAPVPTPTPTPAPPAPGIGWWVWLIVGLAVVTGAAAVTIWWRRRAA